MASTGIPEFVQSLGASRLLTDAQIRTLRRQLEGQSLNAEALAQILIRQQHLTEWQASQLLKGQSGFVLDHYHLLNPVGRGGMGHVFRGRDSRDQSIVAVKVMARRLTDNQTLVSRFQREIKASSRLRSSNIVRTLDAGRVGKVDFMVMEFVNGDQVDRIANRLGRLPVKLACELVRQIAEGLQHAHQHHMVHRDIKPSNMMIHWNDEGHGVAKLMDMGLVLLLADNEDERTVTRAGQVMGTPDYMSPEQGWDTTRVDIRSDIYSLGCTLFRLLSGRIPFSGTNPLQVLSQRLQRDAPSLTTVCDDLPDGVVRVVERMTRRDPDERFQTPAEVAAALQPFAQPLLKAEFQQAARHATSNPDADISAPDSDVVDESDVTYRQFLAEVEDNSSVDLMLATDDNMAVSANTLPAMDLKVDAGSARHRDIRRAGSGEPGRGSRRRQRASRRRKVTIQGLMAMGGLFAVLLLLLAVSHFTSNPADSNDNFGPAAARIGEADAPDLDVEFLAAEPATARTGELWKFQPEIRTARDADLTFELGESAPATAKIDAATGAVRWQIPETQTPGDYEFELRVHRSGYPQIAALASTTVAVSVEIGMDTIRLPNIGPFQLGVAEEFQANASVLPFSARELPLNYELQSRLTAGLTIDQQTGKMTWQPAPAAIGRHDVKLSVKTADGAVLDEATVRFEIQPTAIEHVLAELPSQKAAAGDLLEVPLPLPADVSPSVFAVRLLAAGPNSPPGVTIAPDSRTLRWSVPPTTDGAVSVPLVAAIDTGDGVRRRLNGTRLLNVQISATPSPAGTSPDQSTLPPDELIAAAVDELKQTWRTRLVAARTPQQKAALGWELLEAGVDAQATVAEAARLQLIEDELARPAHAVDLLMRISDLRHKRFATQKLPAALSALKLFRRSSLSYVSADLLVEECTQLARHAVEVQDVAAAADFLKLLQDLSKGSSASVGGPLLQDVRAAAKLCDEMIAEPEAATNDVRRAEAVRLLKPWEFEPLFTDGVRLAYFGIREAGSGPVNGRGYWTLEDSTVRLKGVSLQAAVGFTSAAQPRGRYVARMDVAPDTTSVQFVIGATGTGDDFAAYGIVLDASGPGRILDVRNRNTVAEPSAAAPWSADRANRIEVLVDGTSVRVSVNGTIANRVQLPMLQAGRLGMAANLGVPQPRVEVRDVRVLPLPEQP